MGQKVSPIGFRTGIRLPWKSKWIAPKSNYGEFLVEDYLIRKFIDDRLNRQPPYAAISNVTIERTREEVKVTVRTARPGLVIGPRGAEVEKLKEALEDLTNRRVNVEVKEIAKPDLDAQLAAEAIAEQLKRRASFRRTVKQRAEAIMQAGAKGVKIQVSGRLGGAEMSRSMKQIMGSIPLQTLDADVDYGFAPSFTTYGALGVKVWIYRGRFDEQKEEEQVPPPRSRPRRREGRGPRRGAGGGPRAGASGRSGRGPAAGPAAQGPSGEAAPAAPAGPEAGSAPPGPAQSPQGESKPDA